MKIHVLPALSDNFIYVLEDDHKNCALVDPGEARPAENFLRARGLNLKAILCTHHHGDHVGGVPALAGSGVEVWAAPGDYERIAGANRLVKGGEKLELLGEKVEILAVPGHTDGQVSFYFPKLQTIFTGDTLFSCGCGRMFEGNYSQFFESLQKYKALPPDTKVYFGHEYTERNIRFAETTSISARSRLEEYKNACAKRRAAGEATTPCKLGLELEINPFLSAKSVEEFRERRMARDRF